jgi:hypothetical protein
MTHIAGFERDQLLLLPEAVDDYVEADNPVRFVDAFVEGLELRNYGDTPVDCTLPVRHANSVTRRSAGVSGWQSL